MTTYYTYDYAGRVSYLNNTSPYVNAYARFNYTYDNSGNITGVTQNIHGQSTTKTYTYDSVNRVSYETIGDSYYNYYRYDNHNSLKFSGGHGDKYYTYDNNNRLVQMLDAWCYAETADGEVYDDWFIDYEYDDNGKLLSSSKHSQNGYTSNQKEYQYNAWGQMTSYSDSLGESGTYTYWADGLRQSRKVGSNTFKYYYNGGDVINETKNGAEHATNVMGVDGIISRQKGILQDIIGKMHMAM